jgi:protein TonB
MAVNMRGMRISIAANRGLVSVKVVTSSGNAELDKAALSQVRRAAPFPVPPKGAPRQMDMRIKGR